VILTGPVSVWFGLVRNRSDFDSSGSVNRKRVYGLRPKWTELMSRFSSVQYGGRVYAKITKL